MYAGRNPAAALDGKLTSKKLCNRFLTDRSIEMENGELVQPTFWDYRRIKDQFIRGFGKNRGFSDLQPEHFASLRTATYKTILPRHSMGRSRRLRSSSTFLSRIS
ncbi:MAG: hypothetical protein KDA52_02825 [Planctomycetaceae bacterium]|nr:hypothetical protein [Planctomycetaceae bacterium]